MCTKYDLNLNFVRITKKRKNYSFNCITVDHNCTTGTSQLLIIVQLAHHNVNNCTTGTSHLIVIVQLAHHST